MHEYQKRINAAAPFIIGLGKGVGQITVQHDDNCGVFQGNKCRCDPDITLRIDGRSYEILSDGSLKPVN